MLLDEILPSSAPIALYLDDHLTAATGGLRLIERARDAHHDRDPELHRALAALADEVREDRAAVRRMLALVGGTPSLVKQAAAVTGELLGRAKLNGRLIGRSSLSSLVELEAIAIALRGKRCGWVALRAAQDPRLADVDFDGLVDRADRQYEAIERLRQRVAATVLSDGGS